MWQLVFTDSVIDKSQGCFEYSQHRERGLTNLGFTKLKHDNLYPATICP